MIDEDSLRERKAAMLPHLDERQRRLFAAAEAKAAGHGGIAAVARVTRIAASTIGRPERSRGAGDAAAGARSPSGRRAEIAGRDG
jgi:chorismate mutase